MLSTPFQAVVFFGTGIDVLAGEELWSTRSYCMLTTPSNATKVPRAIYLELALDAFSTIGDFALLLVNKRSKKNKVFVEYSLGKSYQLNENDVTLQLIFPLSLIHAATFILTNVYSIAIRTFLSTEDVFLYTTLLELILVLLCAYSAVPLLAFYFFLRRFESLQGQQQRPADETDEYFRLFQAQMEAALPRSKPNRQRRFLHCIKLPA
ncbi:hypothetical protein AAVH_22931 [Aphelenchoides avenae]|nr:hypothetical protein AAVH_22931 [Aphelenchus avenae]